MLNFIPKSASPEEVVVVERVIVDLALKNLHLLVPAFVSRHKVLTLALDVLFTLFQRVLLHLLHLLEFVLLSRRLR